MTVALVRDPIYQQLNSALRRVVQEFRPGQKFLTERQVCQRFDVSRATANKALSNLVVQGVLRFRKGVGTFVCGDALDYDLRALVSFTNKALAAGRAPSTQVLRLASMPARQAGKGAQDALRVAADEPLYYVERLRLADAVPVILERRHIMARPCGILRKADLRGSLYELWTERLRLDIAGAEETIHAVNIRGRDAQMLRVRGGAAGLLVVATGYLADGEPLWFERTLYRGDAYTFHNRLGRIQSARPAIGALTSGRDDELGGKECTK